MSFVRVPPDGAGKKVYTQAHTIGVDQVEAQVLHLADPETPTNLQRVDQRGAASVRFYEGQPALTNSQALHVAVKRILGVYENSTGSYDDLFTVVETGGGTSVYDDNAHMTVVSVDGANGSAVKRTTNRYHYYLPGAANVFLGTIRLSDNGVIGNTRRWGVYDDNDGLFFEVQGATINVVIRSSTTGGVVEIRVPQSSWNVDPADGTGLSGVNLDLSKVNRFWIDFQWSDASRVRFGTIDGEGNRVILHAAVNSNVNNVPYMRTGTLPIRTENFNTAATGTTCELREVCLAMSTEADPDDYTFWRGSDIEASKLVSTAESSIVAIRSKALTPGTNHHNSISVYPEVLNVYTDQPVVISIVQSVGAAGGTWGMTNEARSIEASTDAAIVFGPDIYRAKTLYLGAGTHRIDLADYFELNDEGIMLLADGSYDVWSISARKLGATDANVTVNLGYRELW